MKTLVRCCYLGLIVLIVLIQVTHGQHDQGASDPLAALATRLEHAFSLVGGAVQDDQTETTEGDRPRGQGNQGDDSHRDLENSHVISLRGT